MKVKPLVTRRRASLCTVLILVAGVSSSAGLEGVAWLSAAGAVGFYALTMYCLIELTTGR